MERHPEPAPTSTDQETSIAWAAGLFEGEGFLVRRPVGRRIYLELGIEMRDQDVLQRFVDIMRANGVVPAIRPHGPRNTTAVRMRTRTIKNPKHSDIYTWKTVGNTSETAFQLIRPYLGIRRKAKGDEILAESKRVREALRQPRQCEECANTFVLKDHGHGKRFCSKACYAKHRERQPWFRESANKRNREYKARLRAKRQLEGQTTLT